MRLRYENRERKHCLECGRVLSSNTSQRISKSGLCGMCEREAVE